MLTAFIPLNSSSPGSVWYRYFEGYLSLWTLCILRLSLLSIKLFCFAIPIRTLTAKLRHVFTLRGWSRSSINIIDSANNCRGRCIFPARCTSVGRPSFNGNSSMTFRGRYQFLSFITTVSPSLLSSFPIAMWKPLPHCRLQADQRFRWWRHQFLALRSFYPEWRKVTEPLSAQITRNRNQASSRKHADIPNQVCRVRDLIFDQLLRFKALTLHNLRRLANSSPRIH